MVTRTAWSLDKAIAATSTTGRRWSSMATCQAQRQLAWLLITKLSHTWFMKWVFSNFSRLWSVLAPKRLKNLSKESQTILAKRHTSSCPSCDIFFHSIFFVNCSSISHNLPYLFSVTVLYDAGWQKLCEGTKGLRQKVWTQTKILSPNLRHFVAILRFVAIYALFGNLR